MSIETGDLVPRIYGGFRGVDFRGEEISLVRSPDSLNVWKDYKHTESIRTRPALALKHSFTDTVYGIFFYKGFMIVHSGTKLYKVQNGAKTEIFSGAREAESNAFIYDDIWYFKDGKHYIQYDGNTVSDVVGYIPTTSIGRKAQGGGSTHEDVNMLSDYRINTFLADGVNKEFYLDVINVDDDYKPIVKVDDKAVTNFTVDYAKGKITFTTAPKAPKTDGQDNVSVQFKKAVEIKDKNGNVIGHYRDLVLKCTALQVFDNRVFFSGNPDYPNKLWHCSLNDPSYCSDTDWYAEGMDEARIKGMVAGNNALWVFREPSEANTNVFYHNPVTDDQYGKVYPSSHSSITIGCVGKAINFNDDIIFFSERGMEGISGDITTEQVAAHRSSLVDRKLISEPEYENMLLEEWEGYLLIFIGDKVYLADSRTAFTNENHIEYEFFYWQLEKKATSVKVYNGILYVGTEDGVYTMTATTDEYGFYIPRVDITSYWTTPKDKFKTPHKLKTTNKRGCVVEATGDISVYAKIEDTDFELIGVYENVKDYFTSRIKRKKWKDIQLKFYSDTRFSLETATLEAFVGGYIKR
ncbi:MAG: hypothetical protein J6S14_05045 [Clostridia bacterium]|nr:hypothetical protein [Clostridia bacterium]